MFKVYFKSELFAEVPTLENACSLGLAVHSSSNVPHHIVIRRSDGSEVISFDMLLDKKEK